MLTPPRFGSTGPVIVRAMRRVPPALLLLVALAASAALSGCGGGETVSPTAATVVGTLPTTAATGTTATTGGGGANGDPAAGKKVFASAGCGGCHTLKDAGSSGNVGPNLDDAKPPYALVVDRVTNGKGPMPSFKGQLSPQDIQNVAAYVSSVAGK
jgi:sulfite dehydrogenase